MAEDKITQTFVDDEYQQLTDEFEQIRKNIDVYAGRDGNEGCIHLLKEAVANSIDECVNKKNTFSSKKIDVIYDHENSKFTVADEGRGIPYDIMLNAVTKKHVSTKFDRGEETKGFGGLHGVGIKLIAALSDYMVISSYRNHMVKVIEVKDGEVIDHKPEKNKKDQHGLIIEFIPSQKYLDGYDITPDDVQECLRKLSYQIPPEIKLTYYGKLEGTEKMQKIDYSYKGLASDVNYLSGTLEFAPIEVTMESQPFDIAMAFSYDKTNDDMVFDAYCNYINTYEGGNHVLACQRAICDFFTREAKKLDPNNKYEVIFDDCKKGLVMAVSCQHVSPKFTSQEKVQIENKDVLTDGKKGIQNALMNYFFNNQASMRKIIGYLRTIAKVRMEAHKIKGVKMQKPTTFLDDAEIKGFANVTDRNYRGYRELYIVEGDSAASALKACRNAKYQAIFGVFGVTDNVYGLTEGQLLQKETFRNLTNVLGCGIGASFDITKLRFNKVIICTDSDIDGNNITSLVAQYFHFFLPELLANGKVYKAIPPLYTFDKKSLKKYSNANSWIYDKKEYYALFNKIIAQNVSLVIEQGDVRDPMAVELGKKQVLEFLDLNSEYLLELDSLVNRSSCNPTILEYVCWYKIITRGDEERFKKLIEKQFPEIKYNIAESSLYGSYNAEQISLICDAIFMKMAKRFIKLLSQNAELEIYCKNANADEKLEKMTIGEFLTAMGSRYAIKIAKRFKGLGEASAELLFMTTMNPKMRKLIRLNLKDVAKTNEIFELLHGKSEAMRQARRDLLENADISYADIDN